MTLASVVYGRQTLATGSKGDREMTKLTIHQLQILYARICKNYDYSTPYAMRLHGMRIRVLNECYSR